MGPKLYMTEMSPPSRGSMLAAKAIGLQLEYVNLNFLAKDHLKPEYIKKNPQHTIPLLEDGDFLLCDSHAISAYLVTVYGKDDSLLPKEPKFRARVDQRLFFDTELFIIFKNAVRPLWLQQTTTYSQNTRENVDAAMAVVEIFLNQHIWVAGSRMTIADLSLGATISTLNEMLLVDESKFPRIADWLRKLECLPFYEDTNARGARALGEVVKSKLSDYNIKYNECCGNNCL